MKFILLMLCVFAPGSQIPLRIEGSVLGLPKLYPPPFLLNAKVRLCQSQQKDLVVRW